MKSSQNFKTYLSMLRVFRDKKISNNSYDIAKIKYWNCHTAHPTSKKKNFNPKYHSLTEILDKEI